MAQPDDAADPAGLARLQLYLGRNAPAGQRVVPGSVSSHGRRSIRDQPRARHCQQLSGQRRRQLRRPQAGPESRTGMMDVDAFELFVKNNPSLMPGPLDRVTRMN